MPLSHIRSLGLIVLSCAFSAANGQQTQPSSIDPLRQVLASMTSNTNIDTVSMTGFVTKTAGSAIERGSITLYATVTGNTRIDMTFPSGTVSEVHTQTDGALSGAWRSTSGNISTIPLHNLYTDPAWFFPLFPLLHSLSTATVGTRYVGLQTLDGVSVTRYSMIGHNTALTPQIRHMLPRIADVSFFVDAGSQQLSAIAFDTHADNDARKDIPVDIHYSAWTSVDGLLVPFHIQKLLNGTLFLDITISNASLNKPLPDSSFQLQ